jgi:hypothetical protein
MLGIDDEHPGRTWFFRIASVAALAGVVIAIGVCVHKGQAFPAAMLVIAVVPIAVLFAWSWTGSLFGSLSMAKRYVEGVEGSQRHEWHAFKGQRVRVFLDEKGRPWFALNEIAFILTPDVNDKALRHFGPREIGIPAAASEKCLSEAGLRRLIKHSKHIDAGALGLWLERDVLRMLRNRAARDSA